MRRDEGGYVVDFAVENYPTAFWGIMFLNCEIGSALKEERLELCLLAFSVAVCLCHTERCVSRGRERK